MPEVITLGEFLIDFVPTVSGVGLIDAPAFKKAPGGAPANVAVGLTKLGVSSGFMGKVGDDAFGHFLAKTLVDCGVDTSSLCYSATARTALAFVSLSADGEREFMFYRNPSADMLYSSDEVDEDYIGSAKVFHFGSISLISEPSRSATLTAVNAAKKNGLLISYDPNLRLSLWTDSHAAKQGIMLGWQHAQIIKISEEELEFLTGTINLDNAAAKLWHPDLRILLVTKGKNGCSYITRDFAGEVRGFKVDAVDTTGAGDGFVAGVIKQLLENPRADKDQKKLGWICRYANAVGALTTTERGAIPALPTQQQVIEFLRNK